MRRHLSEMTIPELHGEHKKMVAAIDRLKDTQDHDGLFQLRSARALKFALECQLKARLNKLPAPAPLDVNVLDFAAYKRRADAKRIS